MSSAKETLEKIIAKTIKSEIFYIRWFSKIVVFFILFVSFIFFVDKAVMPYIVSSDVVEVPMVEGLMLEDAQKVLNSRNLRAKVVSKKFDDKAPAGQVILQKPKAKSLVKENRYIYLAISGGESLISMPNLVGRSVKEVKFILERLNLDLASIKEVESQEPVGFVISQNYPEGTMLKKNSQIHITVSGGATHGKIKLPDLIGKSYKEAEKILYSYGIRNIIKSYQESRILLPNTVVEQYPAKNKLVGPRDTVKLILTIESGNQIGEGTD